MAAATRKPILQDARLIKSFGWEPALSRDGKLLAYSSSVGGGEQHIWVQQTAGGEAIQVTSGPDAVMTPDFSPDGTHIAFYFGKKWRRNLHRPNFTWRTQTLSRDPLHETRPPRFSPRGDSILYMQDLKLFTVSVNGGQPTALPLNQDFRVYSPPIWAPSGKEILLYGARNNQQKEAPSWWIVPLACRPCHAGQPSGSGAKLPTWVFRAGVGSDRRRPRMDHLLDR